MKILLTSIICFYCSLAFSQSLFGVDLPQKWTPSSPMASGVEENNILPYLSNNALNAGSGHNIALYLENQKGAKSNHLSNRNLGLGDYINLEGHPKAKGVNLKIRKPKGWGIEEGNRPNVLKTFSYDNHTYVILIKDNIMFVSRKEARGLLEEEEFNTNFINESVLFLKEPRIINQKVVTIDNYPALEFTVFGNKEQLGYNLNMYLKYWIIFYEDKIITLLGGSVEETEFYAFENLYDSITSSIILLDQYK